MRIFQCDHCQQLVFFENVQCVACKHALAYLPDLSDVGSLEKVDDALWKARAPEANGRLYRLCRNYRQQNICNWAVPADDPNPYCSSCRLTRVIPALGRPDRVEAWYALEVAKRRLVYSLMALGLPLASKTDDFKQGVAFEFLADPEPGTPGAPKVLTGHADGVITVNIAEADDAERERCRVSMHEPYRTLLGHFRHEIGHYYWDRLVRDSSSLDRFRELFGDERADTTLRLATRTTYRDLPPAGKSASSQPTPAATRGKTGPKRGRTTCISPTLSKRRVNAAWSCCRIGTTSTQCGPAPRCGNSASPSSTR